MDNHFDRQQRAREAKAIVALAFRNGPIEDLHAGTACPTCTGQSGYSRITDEEMKRIMQNSVDHVYALLCLKKDNWRSTTPRFDLAKATPGTGMNRPVPGEPNA